MKQLSSWQLLIVDDDEEICQNLKTQLESLEPEQGKRFSVQYTTTFEDAVNILDSQKIDLAILDVRVGAISDEIVESEQEAGRKTLAQIKKKVFIPIIFHTALPLAVEDLQSRFIRVVAKDLDSDERLLEEIQSILETRLPEINRAIIQHFEQVQRKYMWDFVHENWCEFEKIDNKTELAHLLARRLAVSLSVEEISNLETQLGGLIQKSNSEEGKNHPMRFYIIPPISEFTRVCDIYKEGNDSYWLVLSPSCDLVLRNGKYNAEFITLAACDFLSEQEEYQAYQDLYQREDSKFSKQKKQIRKNITKLIENRNPEGRQQGRYFFLPGVLTIPDMVVDFQNLRTIPSSELLADSSAWMRVASIDSPFRESLISQFNIFFGRIGTPDLNTEITLKRIESFLNNE